MSAILMDIAPFSPTLDAGGLVLTANNRQKIQILRAYNSAQKTSSWNAPRVETLNQWLARLWQSYLFNPACVEPKIQISKPLSELVWSQILENSASASQLLQSAQLARLAEDARRSLDGWTCPLAELDSPAYSDPTSAQFVLWYRQYHEQLDELNLITQEGAQNKLIDAFNKELLPTERHALLYGIDELSPLAQKLLALALPGASSLPPAPHASHIELKAYRDNDEEIHQAALWADQVLAKDADAVIGIVVPNLGQIRQKVESTFQSIFTPLAPLPGQERIAPPYNFSTGTPLSDTGAIGAVVDLLQVILKRFSIDTACNFLSNPFFGQYNLEKNLRTVSAQALRRQAKANYRFKDIHQQLQFAQERSQTNTALTAACQDVAGRVRRWDQMAPLHHWQEELLYLLDKYQWPGERPLDSLEHQQVSLFYEVMDSLQALSTLKPMSTFRWYVDQLIKALKHTPFQPQTPNSPIQILGTLEAAGLQFTHLWVLGMHNGNWPETAKPNPLLPHALQKKWAMPKSSPEKELEFATRITDRLAGGAKTLVVTYPQSEGDKRLQPSALVLELDAKEHKDCQENAGSMEFENYQTIVASGELEIVHCDKAPTLDTKVLPGGTGILKAQANCPFTAFARYRLGARQPTEPSLGYTPIERGLILHQTLDNFWQRFSTQENLRELTNDQLQEVVRQLIEQAQRDTCQQTKRDPGVRYRHLELERMQALIVAWLDEERQRPPFHVAHTEQQVTCSIGAFQVNVQVDRIDKLENDQFFIIDYKTGKTSTKHWQIDSFFDPQLPLYACTLYSGSVVGVGFGTINSQSIGFCGWGDDLQIHGISEAPSDSWAIQLEQWKHSLENLAAEIQEGYAVVDYRNKEALRFDEDLLPLNRLQEHSSLVIWSQAK